MKLSTPPFVKLALAEPMGDGLVAFLRDVIKNESIVCR
jgi:hypothetical protein